MDVPTTDERLHQLETQQALQTQALAALLADHYDDGAASAKAALVALNKPQYEGLVVVEKQNAGKADGGEGGGEYPVIWIGSPNHYYDDLHDVVAFVVHTMAGSLASCDSWFKNPSSQVSSHYGTGLGGQLHQYVALTDGAWANGVLEPGNKWQGRYGGENPNHRVISCETEDLGNPHQAVTDEEYAATLAAGRLALAAWPSIEVVSSHHVISPSSRPNCCGDRWIRSGALTSLAVDLGLELFI